MRSARDGAESGRCQVWEESLGPLLLPFWHLTARLTPGHVGEGDTTRYLWGRSRSEMAAVPMPWFLGMKTARTSLWVTKTGRLPLDYCSLLRLHDFPRRESRPRSSHQDDLLMTRGKPCRYRISGQQ